MEARYTRALFFLSILQPIKYLKPLFLLQENLLDKNITSISTLSMMVRILEELNFCCFDFLTTEVQNFFVYYLLIIILKKTYFVTNYNYIGKKVFLWKSLATTVTQRIQHKQNILNITCIIQPNNSDSLHTLHCTHKLFQPSQGSSFTLQIFKAPRLSKITHTT